MSIVDNTSEILFCMLLIVLMFMHFNTYNHSVKTVFISLFFL